MSYQIPQEYELYLDRLIEEAHGHDLPMELKTEMKRDLYGRLENHLLTSFIQALPNEKSQEFDQLMSTGPATDEVQTFFQNNIENTQELSAQALLEFRDIYVGGSK